MLLSYVRPLVVLSNVGFAIVCAVVSSRHSNRRQLFGVIVVNTVLISSLSAALGFVSGFAVVSGYGVIPGTASAGGEKNGIFYFNWHDEKFTEVPAEVWRRAYFLEQLTGHFAVSSFMLFFSSLALLVCLTQLGWLPKEAPVLSQNELRATDEKARIQDLTRQFKALPTSTLKLSDYDDEDEP